NSANSFGRALLWREKESIVLLGGRGMDSEGDFCQSPAPSGKSRVGANYASRLCHGEGGPGEEGAAERCHDRRRNASRLPWHHRTNWQGSEPEELLRGVGSHVDLPKHSCSLAFFLYHFTYRIAGHSNWLIAQEAEKGLQPLSRTSLALVPATVCGWG